MKNGRKILKSFFAIFLLAFGILNAQSPGGVGTANLRGWFDASIGVTVTSGAVSAWQDRSGIGNATQGTSGERPTVSTSTINYNNTLLFDGTNDNLDLADRMSSTVTALSAYAVARQIATNRDSWGSVFNGQVNGPAWTGGGYGLVALTAGSTIHGFYVRDYNTKGVAFSVTNNVPFLISGNWNGTTSNNVQAFKNGASAGTIGYTPGSVGDAGASWIGSGNGTNTDYCFYGDIAEVAIYNAGLSAANNNKVMSYLALKYGITMGINYTNSAGTVVYTTSGAYVNNIIGVSRDDGSGLIQKQSRTYDDSLRIYISSLAASNSANAGTFSSNLSNVMIGSDNGNMCTASTTTAEIPSGSGVVTRLNREWKISNTNFGGTFSIDLRLNACSAPGSVSVANLRLMLDDDGNFSAGTNSAIPSGSNGITISYSNPVITISGISTSLIASGATSFMTIGSVSFSTPLPIRLRNFESKTNQNNIDLMWSTASELNSAYFEIEKSRDAENFEVIERVNSKAINGNSNGIINYQMSDNMPFNGVNYYRLKQVDKDNSFTYSSIIEANYNRESDITFLFYPSPAKEEITAKISGLPKQSDAIITIYDSMGNEVHESLIILNVNQSEYKLQLNNKLSSGVYLAKLRLNNSEYQCKLLIKAED